MSTMATTKELRILMKARNEFSKSFNTLEKSTSDLNKKMTGLSQTTGKLIKGAIGLFAFHKVAGLLRDSAQAAKEFESGLARVNTINRKTGDGLKEFNKEFEKLVKNLPQANAELAEGLFFIASAGVEASKQLDVLTASSAAAIAAGTDVQTIFRGLSAVVKGFGMTFADTGVILGKFFKINELGQTTIADVSNAIQSVTSVAQVAGVTFDEVAAVFATFTGVTGDANVVATQLRGAMLALAAPTSEARKNFDKLGVEIGKAAIRKKGFATVVKEVVEAVDGNAEALRKLIPNVRGINLIIALGTTLFDKYGEKIEKVSNATQEDMINAAKIMVQTQEGQQAIMKKQADAFKVTMGKVVNVMLSSTFNVGLGMTKLVKAMILSIGQFGKEFSNVFSLVVFVAKENFVALKNIFKVGAKDAFDIFARNVADFNKFLVEDAVKSQKKVKDAWAEVSEFAKDPAAAATRAFIDETTGALNDLASGSNDTARALDKLGLGGANSMEEMSDDAEKAQKKFVENARKMRQEIVKLSESLKDLKIAHQESLAGFDKTIGEKVVEQEEKVKKIEEEIADARKSGDSDRISELHAILNQEKFALKDFMGEQVGFEDEISEARRRNRLTDFERFIEDIELRREARITEFEEKKSDIEKEIEAKEAALEKEREIFQGRRDEFEKTRISFNGMAIDFDRGMVNMEKRASNTAKALQVALTSIRNLIAQIRALTAPKEGRDTRTDPQVFAQTRVEQPFPDGTSPFAPPTSGQMGRSSSAPAPSGASTEPPKSTNIFNIKGNSFRDRDDIDHFVSGLSRQIQLQQIGA